MDIQIEVEEREDTCSRINQQQLNDDLNQQETANLPPMIINAPMAMLAMRLSVSISAHSFEKPCEVRAHSDATYKTLDQSMVSGGFVRRTRMKASSDREAGG